MTKMRIFQTFFLVGTGLVLLEAVAYSFGENTGVSLIPIGMMLIGIGGKYLFLSQ